jgi:hypothetical protein
MGRRRRSLVTMSADDGCSAPVFPGTDLPEPAPGRHLLRALLFVRARYSLGITDQGILLFSRCAGFFSHVHHFTNIPGINGREVKNRIFAFFGSRLCRPEGLVSSQRENGLLLFRPLCAAKPGTRVPASTTGSMPHGINSQNSRWVSLYPGGYVLKPASSKTFYYPLDRGSLVMQDCMEAA